MESTALYSVVLNIRGAGISGRGRKGWIIQNKINKIIICYYGLILLKTPMRMKVLGLFWHFVGSKSLNGGGGSLLRDIGVEKLQFDPFQLSTKE